jgi:ABC-type lipoprotein release transport system permease subunit
VQSGVFAQGLRLTIIGVVIGLAGASYVTRVLRADLVDITPADPETFAAVVAAVLVLTSLACWIPARRTTQVDPVSVLRAE